MYARKMLDYNKITILLVFLLHSIQKFIYHKNKKSFFILIIDSFLYLKVKTDITGRMKPLEFPRKAQPGTMELICYS